MSELHEFLEDLKKDDLTKFIGGQLERGDAFRPVKRGEIKSLEIKDYGALGTISITLSWAAQSLGDIKDYEKKGWISENNESPVIKIPFFFDTFAQKMDIGRILLIIMPMPLNPIRYLIMARDCGTFKKPRSKKKS